MARGFAMNGEDPLNVPGLADAFLVSTIAVGMKLGEDIQVEGVVSSRLAHGLQNYQNILNTWWPETFDIIDIHYESLEDRRVDLRPTGVACTFSGGLDSL
jgi:hypothetical protein